MSVRKAFQGLILAGIGTALALAGENVNPNDPINLAVEGGSASFVANTNVPAVSIKGKSNALKAQVIVRRGPEGLRIERIEAALPVKSLQTGMGLRDEHMRKYIFTTRDGHTPDVLFQAENVACPAGARMTCNVSGSLTIRGVPHPFSVPLKVREDGDGYKAAGESVIKLSDYHIEQPSQFGVKTANEVEVRLDFIARPVPMHLSSLGGVR